jgi:hypothetical protein
MQLKHRFAVLLCAAPLALAGQRAMSDSLTVNISNDGTDDIVVTIYDTSHHQRTVILSQRVNGFSTVPVNIPENSRGSANLSWAAVTVDTRNRRCGYGNGFGLDASSTVTVHADAECEARPTSTDGDTA